MKRWYAKKWEAEELLLRNAGHAVDLVGPVEAITTIGVPIHLVAKYLGVPVEEIENAIKKWEVLRFLRPVHSS